MVKKTFLVLMCFIGLIIFVSTLHSQGSKKTITLPNGEVVWDLNGEWDALYENLGVYQQSVGKITDILKITQQGGSFEGVKTIGSIYVPQGAVSIRGELDKNGVNKVLVVLVTGRQQLDCKGQISEDGNKIIIDGGERIRVTLTRK